jgi:Brp/Blh family beta-carotene 15,15'-monooxygenase
MLCIHYFIPSGQFLSQSIIIAGFIFPGLTHGALDAHLIRHQFPQSSLTKIIIGYVAITLLIVALWFWSSFFILLFFIVYSSFHFGELDLQLTKHKGIFHQIIYGILLLSIYLFFHATEVSMILEHMLGVDLASIDFSWSNSAGFVSFFVWALYVLQGAKRPHLLRLLVRVALVGVSQLLPLIQGFGIYYFIIHSWPSLVLIKESLNISMSAVLKLSLPYVMATIIFCIGLILFSQQTELSLDFIYAALFMAISAISLPHTLVMHRLNSLRS